jgi:glycosyltransferase involved in cell wall biosynthesis
VFNHPWLIRRAVDLILGQTYRDFQLVVTNDAGPPPWDRLESIRDTRLVRFNMKENRGPYYANHVALTATEHEYFTVHDSDDWSQNDRLEVLLSRIGGAEAAVDGWTRHGSNGQATKIKSTPTLVGHRGTRSLWHIAHHKGLWRTESVRRLTFGPQFRVGWDTYLMHLAALALKVEWVDYYGYNQERQPGSLITSAKTGPNSKFRAQIIVEMDRLWNEVKAEPDRLDDILKPVPTMQAHIDSDVKRLRALL